MKKLLKRIIGSISIAGLLFGTLFFSKQTEEISAAPAKNMKVISEDGSPDSLDAIAEKLVRELVGANFDDLVEKNSCHLIVPNYDGRDFQNHIAGTPAKEAVGFFSKAPFQHVNSNDEHSFLNPVDKQIVTDLANREIEEREAAGETLSAAEKQAIFNEEAEGVLFTTGIILSTGKAEKAEGPNLNGYIDDGAGGYGKAENIASGAFNQTNTGAEDLTALLNDTSLESMDTVRLVFDFKPDYSNVQFQYVFASEEYPDFVGDTFNDVFAFFIDEVDQDTGQVATPKKNHALLPGSQTVVSINNVNDGSLKFGTPAQNIDYYTSNNLYFEDDGTASQHEPAAPPIAEENALDSRYNGFTKVLTASSNSLKPGSIYRMEFAITDIFDDQYDSAVFLASNSFRVLPDASMDYQNVAYPLADISDLTVVNKIVSEAGMVVNDNANGGTIKGSYSFADQDQVDALLNNPKDRPYPLDIKFFATVPGSNDIEIEQRIWVFPTVKNTVVDKTTKRVIYGDDYSLELYTAGAETKGNVYTKGKIRVYDYASDAKTDTLITLADSLNNTGLNITNMPVINDATGAGVVQPTITYTETVNGTSVTTQAKIDVTITGGVILNVRQVIMNSNTEVIVPSQGYFQVGNTNGATISNSYNITVPSGSVDTVAFEKLQVAISNTARLYTIDPVIPEMYKYYGYRISTTEANHATAALELAPDEVEIDYSSNGTYYVTIYLEPSVSNSNDIPFHNWDYQLNEFGNITE